MIRLAFAGPQYAEQVRTNPRALTGVEVVACGQALRDLEAGLGRLRPDVLVVGLPDLGDPPRPRLERLLAESAAALVVVVYTYARRDVVVDLAALPRVRVVQGPLSLANLRCQMLDLIVGDILADAAGPARPAGPAPCPTCGAPPRRPAAGVA